MSRTITPFVGLLTGITIFITACNSESEVKLAAGSAECFQNSDCPPQNECSAGRCFTIQSCETNAVCATAETCADGICRAACESDEDCASTNGTCESISSLCMASANLTPSGSANPGQLTAAPESGTAPTSTGGIDSEMAAEAPAAQASYDVIDDFEDLDTRILSATGRDGYWYDYSDANGSRPLAAEPALEDGRLAIHAQGSHGSGVTADQAYGGLGVELNNASSADPIPAAAERGIFDVSDWDGFQFWIKAGDASTKSIRFELVTTAIAGTAEQGRCSAGLCWDSYGRDIALSTDWQLVQVPFQGMVQEGWGDEKNLDLKTLMGIAFEDRTTSSWDFYVGEMALYQAASAPTVSLPTAGSCDGSWGGYEEASITQYWFTQGTVDFGDINCSYGIETIGTEAGGDRVYQTPTGSGGYFGAMNTADYAGSAACGACAEVTADNGKSVTITIVDQCPIDSNPLCIPGHIDLSVDAYNELGLPTGYYGKGAQGKVGWKFVPCPSSGDIELRLKEPTNSFWNMVIVENHQYPIALVEVETDRGWLKASREAFNFWLPPGGNMGTGQVRVTDINGNSVTGSVSTSGGTATQLSCQ